MRRRAEAYAGSGQTTLAARIQLVLGAAYQDAAQPELASPFLNRGLELSSTVTSESPSIPTSLEISAELLFLLGNNYGALGAQQISAQYLVRSADAYEESGQHDLSASASSAAAAAYRGLRELRLAAELYEASAEAYEKLGQYAVAGKLFFEAGEASRDNKDFERSARDFRRSTEAYETSESPGEAARSYFRLGLAYRGLGDLEKSTEAFERAIQLSGSEHWVNDAHRNLTEIYSAQRRTEAK